MSVTGGSGRESRVGLRLEVSVHHEDDEDDDLLSHQDTEVSLVPGAPLRCVSATNTSLDRNQIKDSGDVVFKIRLVTIFTLSELDFYPTHCLTLLHKQASLSVVVGWICTLYSNVRRIRRREKPKIAKFSKSNI